MRCGTRTHFKLSLDTPQLGLDRLLPSNPILNLSFEIINRSLALGEIEAKLIAS